MPPPTTYRVPPIWIIIIIIIATSWSLISGILPSGKWSWNWKFRGQAQEGCRTSEKSNNHYIKRAAQINFYLIKIQNKGCKMRRRWWQLESPVLSHRLSIQPPQINTRMICFNTVVLHDRSWPECRSRVGWTSATHLVVPSANLCPALRFLMFFLSLPGQVPGIVLQMGRLPLSSFLTLSNSLFTSNFFITYWTYKNCSKLGPPDRHCGLVVRVPGYRSRGPGFDSRRYHIFW
jgi:hypothetical protein